MKITTNDKGDVGVAMVIADLTANGMKVALPISGHLPFDLVAISENYELSRISVKYSGGDEFVHLSTRTISPAAKERARPVNLDYIDAYAVYSPITKEVYYVAKKHLVGRKSGMQLRIVESKTTDNRIHYARDFKNIKDLFWKCG